jgi:hypothetical protein
VVELIILVGREHNTDTMSGRLEQLPVRTSSVSIWKRVSV